MRKTHYAGMIVFVCVTAAQANPLTESDKEIQRYTKTIKRLKKIAETHPDLPLGSCLYSILPHAMNSIKPVQLVRYQKRREALAKLLHFLQKGIPTSKHLQRIPSPCQNTETARKVFEKLLKTTRGRFETVLATSILLYEKYELVSKAKQHRKLYKKHFPHRNLEKEFKKRYGTSP